MKAKGISIYILCGFISHTSLLHAQSRVESSQSQEKKYQAKAPPTEFFGNEAFESSDKTEIRWLGSAGFFINSRGTTFMVDPVLEGFHRPLLREVPIKPNEVPHLDAILVTHSDNDHYSVSTCRNLASVTSEYHSTHYVDSLMRSEDLKSFGHDIGDVFSFENVRVTLTPADHAHQNSRPQPGQRYFKYEDFCGFWIETQDGIIWAPGDSRLIPDHHLKMRAPDALFFDFSDSDWHFGLEDAVKIANTYPNTPLLLYHWGTIDAPDRSPFNGDPKDLEGLIVNPERIYLLAPGEPFILKRVRE